MTSTSGGNRHGPNSFANYQEVHNRRMQDFMQGGFVTSHNLRFGAPTHGCISLEGDIHCLGGITINVRKQLKILSGTGAGAVIQTSGYSYNAFANGRGIIVRYDSPHDDHNQFHHVHRHDYLGSWSEIDIEPLLESEVPTLADVIEEVHDIYYGNEF